MVSMRVGWRRARAGQQRGERTTSSTLDTVAVCSLSARRAWCVVARRVRSRTVDEVAVRKRLAVAEGPQPAPSLRASRATTASPVIGTAGRCHSFFKQSRSMRDLFRAWDQIQ